MLVDSATERKIAVPVNKRRNVVRYFLWLVRHCFLPHRAGSGWFKGALWFLIMEHATRRVEPVQGSCVLRAFVVGLWVGQAVSVTGKTGSNATFRSCEGGHEEGGKERARSRDVFQKL